MKEFKNKKSIKITMIVAKTFATIILIGFIITVLLQKYSNNEISFFDYRMFTVITGSMKPKYDIGDVLIAKKTDPKEVKIGDSISYLGKVGSFNNKVITHEVIGIEKDVDGSIIFRAKGLANLVEDPEVKESQLFGVVIYKSVILSTIYKIVSTNIGFYLFIIIPLVYVIGSQMLSFLLGKEEKRRKEIQ